MDNTSAAERRVEQLRQQLAPPLEVQYAAQIQPVPCAVHHRSLPRFDVTFMEHYLETDRSLKNEVYDLFKQHPELLYPVEEGMTKGEQSPMQSQTAMQMKIVVKQGHMCRAAQRVCAQTAQGHYQ